MAALFSTSSCCIKAAVKALEEEEDRCKDLARRSLPQASRPRFCR